MAITQRTTDWKKYVIVFGITATIFATALYASNYFGQKKLDEIRSIQDKIAIDILSSETQFSLLEESSCKNFGDGNLSTDLGTLEDKLTYTENQRGDTDAEVIALKRYYFLLEIKDYILMNRIGAKCKKTPLSVIYFYSTNAKCPDCEKEGFVLTRLRETYPELRVYSFDYNTDLSAVKTLVKIHKTEDQLPALIIQDDSYYGFKSVADLEKLLPELQILKNKESATNKK